MSIASKYNKGGIEWGIETKGFKFKKLAEFNVGQVILVRGIFINHKSKFGDSPAIITDDCKVNLPHHMAETVREMLKDSEFIEAVKAGKVGAKVEEYAPKNRPDMTAYSVEWVDL